jgi:hypothetical protein
MPIDPHPALNGGTFGAMSGEKPLFTAQVEPTHENLVKVLKGMGLHHEETHGRYGGPERSVVVHKPTVEQMQTLGKLFGQESVVHSSAGQHLLVYTNGPHEGKAHRVSLAGAPHELFADPPPDNYTYLPGHGYFRINFDMDSEPQPLNPIQPGQLAKAKPPQDVNMVLADQLMDQGFKPGPGHLQNPAHPQKFTHSGIALPAGSVNPEDSGSDVFSPATGSYNAARRREANIERLADMGMKGPRKPFAESGAHWESMDPDDWKEGNYPVNNFPSRSAASEHSKWDTNKDANEAQESAFWQDVDQASNRSPVLKRARKKKATRKSENTLDLIRKNALKLSKNMPRDEREVMEDRLMDNGANPPSVMPVAQRPHPHAYDWHDPEVLQKADPQHPHMDAPPVVNDQVARAGVPTYHKFAAAYGTLTPGQHTDLLHYPMQGKLPQVENLVKQHGYKAYYGGGKYGKPDLANQNYHTGHLMIYDPTPGNGDFGHEEYTRGWRQIHELSHALTHPEVNRLYGEGRRMGKLGMHRTLNEAMRAVHWEWLAGHKQRELAKQVGIHIPDEAFHKEMNTVMHDALHRAVTGKFTEPSGEGFNPHSHLVPLSHALDMLRQEGANLGLKHQHALMDRNVMKGEAPVISNTSNRSNPVADDKTFTPDEAAAIASEFFHKRMHELSKHVKDLRQRELAKADKKLSKAIIPPHKHTPGMSAGGGIEDVPGANPPGKKDAMKAEESSHEESSGEISADDMEKALLCKKCGKSHELEKGCGELDKAMLKDAKGKEKDNGIHPDSTLPEDKKSEEVSADGSGGDVKKGKKVKKSLAEIRTLAKAYNSPSMVHGSTPPVKGSQPKPQPVSDADHEADKKAAGIKKTAKKAEPPMAKPPSGKNMATHVPTSTTAKPPAPALGKGVMSDIARQNSPPVPGAAAEPKVQMPTPEQHAARAQQFSDFGPAQTFQPQPKGLPQPKAAGVAAAPAKKPGIFGRLMGKSESLNKALPGAKHVTAIPTKPHVPAEQQVGRDLPADSKIPTVSMRKPQNAQVMPPGSVKPPTAGGLAPTAISKPKLPVLGGKSKQPVAQAKPVAAPKVPGADQAVLNDPRFGGSK